MSGHSRILPLQLGLFPKIAGGLNKVLVVLLILGMLYKPLIQKALYKSIHSLIQQRHYGRCHSTSRCLGATLEALLRLLFFLRRAF